MKFFVSVILCFNFSVAWASKDLIKRVAVFPIEVQKELRTEADKSWWSIREELSRSKKFLVASRLFMQKNEVFQSRSELEPADAIILGKLLDAHAIITCFIREQQIHLQVYSGKQGHVLWKTHLFSRSRHSYTSTNRAKVIAVDACIYGRHSLSGASSGCD